MARLGCYWRCIVTIVLLGLLGHEGRAQSILREYWLNLSGSLVTDLTLSPLYPNNPSGTSYPTLFEAPVNFGDNYGTRMRGYVTPPTTGNYIFWISGDNQCQLFLSTNNLPSGKRLIAEVTNYTSSREWTRETNQQSVPISLLAGQKYYIEALHKEANGGDSLAVGWQLPGGALDRPISGAYLSPWIITSNTPVILAQPASQTVTEYSDVSFFVEAAGSEPLYFQWFLNGQPLAGEISGALLLYQVRLEDSGSQFHCLISNLFGAVTSQVAMLTVEPDNLAPVVQRLHPPAGLTVRSLAEIEVYFSEPVRGVEAADLLVNDQPATNLTGSGAGPYVFRFPPLNDGLARLAWAPNHGITDYSILSNALAGNTWEITVNSGAFPGDLVLNEFLAANENGLKDEDGEYQDWIEILNRGNTTVNLAGWSLTDDPAQPGLWPLPATNLAPGQFLVVFASGKDRSNLGTPHRPHTNFRLGESGEFLALFNPDSPRVAVTQLSPKYPAQRNDISYGLDSSNAWNYYLTPTPGAANSGLTATGMVEQPHFSVRRGFFSAPFNLTLVSPTEGAVIRYTTNASVPTEANGFLYTNKIPISQSTLLRAAAFKPGQLSSRVITHTYLFNQTAAIQSLPVLSLVTDSNNLTGPTGIMGIGGGTYSNGVWQAVNPGDYFNPTNRGLAWERPVSAEYLMAPDNSGFQIDCGIRVQGSDYTRPRYTVTSKFSFRLYFRGDYGEGTLQYPFFPEAAVQEFDQLVLRAGHNDISNPFIKDELVRRLGIDMGQPQAHGNFVNLFVNGAYKGYYNPTERVDNNFMRSWHGGGDLWDVLVQNARVLDGDAINFNSLRAFLTNNNLAVAANYRAAAAWLDMTNFVDYLLVNLYGATSDWPHNNWRAGRERVPGALWRFYLWDAEGAFGGTIGGASGKPDEDVFARALNTGTTDIPRFYRSLTNSPEFRLLFADRVQKHFFNGGALMNENVTNHYYRLRADLAGVIPSMNLNIVTNWVPNRRSNLFNHFALYHLAAHTNAPVFNKPGGRVSRGFNLTMSTTAGTIYYTTNGADPRVAFSGAVSPDATAYAGGLSLGSSMTVKARALAGATWSALTEADFSADELGSPLRFSEIMFDPPGGGAYEFIELENAGGLAVDLGSATFEGIEYKFPEFAVLGPGQRLVLASAANPSAFQARYPALTVAGWFSGSLRNEGERLALKDRNGNTVISVYYLAGPGWPALAAGRGYSLELVSGEIDPSEPAAWRASAQINGSPGLPNATPAAPAVRFEEIMAWNAGSVTNGNNYPDWIELFNPGGSAIPLEGWSLTDNNDPRRFVFPAGARIEAGERLVVWCDTATNAPGWQAGFALNREGENLFLYDANTNLVDAVAFGPQLADYSLGRDAAGGWELNLPTPGTVNQPAPLAAVTNLFINEWLANAPPGGSDWLELFNRSANLPVPLQGVYFGLSNRLCRYRYPAFVAPGGHRLLLADEQPGGTHLDFKLPAAGGVMVLYDPLGVEFHRRSYGAQPENVSQGSLPDGSANLVFFSASQSPGQSNYLLVTNPVVINEVMALNRSAFTNSAGRFADWIELRNTTANPVMLEGMSLCLNQPGQNRWFFPTGTVIGAFGYLTVWCDSLAPPSLTNQAFLNTGQGIESESGAVYLYNAAGQLADLVEFGFQIADLSIGRTASGWNLLSSPTPGQANPVAATLGSTATLLLNEWAANQPGDDDWIEIFNPAGLPVKLDGLFLTDDPSISTSSRFRFSDLSFIGPYGFVVVIADGRPENGRHHANFSLHKLGETLRLLNTNSAILDSVDLGVPPAGYAEIRYPDGSPNLIALTFQPTPQASNYLIFPLTILAPPVSQITTNGSNAVFSVTALGTGALRYQWRREGTNLPGATQSFLVITNATAADEGSYAVQIQDDLQSLVSEPVTLTVLYRPVIIRPPASQVVMAGSNVTFEVEAQGSSPMGFRWRRNSLTIEFFVDQPFLTISNVQASHAGNYTVVVTNGANRTGLLTSPASVLTVVTSAPADQVVYPGADVTFRAGATGSSVTYQWQFDGQPLAGQTNALLVMTNVQASQDGLYSVVITAANAALTTPPASLSVLRPPYLGAAQWRADGRFLLQFQGNLRLPYVIEASTNLIDWETAASVIHTNDAEPISLPAPPDASRRFYRIRLDLAP